MEFGAKGSRNSSHANRGLELAPEAGIRVEDAQHALGDHARAMHADAARGHAAMLGLDDDGDATRPQPFVDGAGNFVRQPFLYLQTPRAGIDHPGELGDAHDSADGHVGDVRFATNGRHVVFAE